MIPQNEQSYIAALVMHEHLCITSVKITVTDNQLMAAKIESLVESKRFCLFT